MRQFNSTTTIVLAACAITLFVFVTSGTAMAAQNKSQVAIESPPSGSGFNQGFETVDNNAVQAANTTDITATEMGDVPPQAIFASIGSRDGNVSINDIVQTENDNFIVIATVGSNANSDGAVAKVSSEGEMVWSTRLRQEGNQSLWSGIQTQTGDYVLAGWKGPVDSFTGWGVKIDEDGEKLWESEPSPYSRTNFFDVEETANGEYLFVGDYTSSERDDNALIVETTSDGEYLRDQFYWDQQERNYQNFFEIERIGEYYVTVGQTYQDDSWDGWAITIDSNLELLDSQTVGHSLFDDWFVDIGVTNQNNLVFAGSRNGNFNRESNEYDALDGWIYYSSSNQEWSETVSPNNVNKFNSIDTSTDRIIAVGESGSEEDTGRSRMAAEFDQSGSQNWISTSADGIDQYHTGVVADGSETYTVGAKKQTENGDYTGYVWQYSTNAGGGAEERSVSLQPADQSVATGGEQTYDVVVDNVDNGVGSLDTTISVGDTSIAEITDVTQEIGAAIGVTESVAADGSSADIEGAVGSLDATGEATIATVTVSGVTTGETVLTIDDDTTVGDQEGNSYTISDTTGAGVTVTDESPSAPGGGTDGRTISLQPAEQSVATGGEQTYDVVVDNVDNGVGTLDITISVGDTSIAEITDVTQEIGAVIGVTESVAADGSSADIEGAAGSLDATGEATIATVTVSGGDTGETTLSINDASVNDLDGNPYSIADTTGGTLTVASGPADLTGNGVAPKDPDGDGLYEDVNGVNGVGFGDLQALFSAFNENRIDAADTQFFNFNGNGGITFGDIQALFAQELRD